MMAYMGPMLAVLAKDALLELRTKDILVSVPVFALLVIVVFNFALDPTPSTVAMIAPGILWVAYTFGGVLGLNRSFAIERDRGNIHGLMLAPVGRDAIYYGKFLGNLSFMLLIEAAEGSRQGDVRRRDLLLLDTGISRVRDGALYVLDLNGDLAVKRIRKKLDGTLVIEGTDADPQSEEVAPADVSSLPIVGRVVWVGRKL